MVILNIFHPLIPLRKSDLFGIGKMGGAAIEGGINAAIAAATNATNASIANKANATNLAINRETTEANVLMNEQTNAMNKQLADEANEFNYKMFTEQNDFNEMMWEKNNDYNTPAAQVQRLIEAGINPNMINSVPTGNSDAPVQSASMPEAQVAHFNPSVLQSAKVDPYRLLPFNVDWLAPMMQAAGISKTQAETKSLELGNDFDASTFKTREEAERASLDFLLKRVAALDQDIDFKGSANSRMLKKLDLANRYQDLLNRSLDQEFARRKAEFAEWSQMAPVRKKQMVATLFKTKAEIDHMSAEDAHMKAQENHWNVQDNLSKEQVGILKHALGLKAADAAMRSYSLNPEVRQSIGEALSQYGFGQEGKLFEDLNLAADGNYNNPIGAIMHTRTGALVQKALDAFLVDYLTQHGIIVDDENVVDAVTGATP